MWPFLYNWLRSSVPQNIKIGGKVFIAKADDQLFRNCTLLYGLFDIRNLAANFSKIRSLCAFSKHSVFISFEDGRAFMRPNFYIMTFPAIAVQNREDDIYLAVAITTRNQNVLCCCVAKRKGFCKAETTRNTRIDQNIAVIQIIKILRSFVFFVIWNLTLKSLRLTSINQNRLFVNEGGIRSTANTYWLDYSVDLVNQCFDLIAHCVHIPVLANMDIIIPVCPFEDSLICRHGSNRPT